MKLLRLGVVYGVDTPQVFKGNLFFSKVLPVIETGPENPSRFSTKPCN